MDKNKFFYIPQSMNQALDIKYFIGNDSRLLAERKKELIPLNISDILSSKNKRYMVVAEPGYGKTRLLKEIVISYHGEAFFIDAKRIKDDVLSSIKSRRCKFFDNQNEIEEKLQSQRLFKNHDESEYKLDSETIVCIDALDEVPFYELYELFEKIDDFLANYGDVKLILSCRTHHIQKIQYDIKSFSFQYIELNAFSGKQIEKYLEYRLQKSIDLNEIYQESKMSNLMDFISIPRYLYYFSELLIDRSLDEITNLSRAEMFDHFIYRKLDKELKEKTHQSQIDLLKRVLEKLALIMKINQVSIISKDELMTVFDQMDSNFSQIAFRDDLLKKLYDNTLIKDNIDFIEFENQQFLDYLSAKELARFEKVEQTFFDVAIEPHLNEVYISWFYVLPFFFELKPFMVEIFLDYIERKKEGALSSEYFEALLSIEVTSIDNKLKSRIFNMVFDYYAHNNHLFSIVLGEKNNLYSLIRYYDNSKYEKISNLLNGYEVDNSRQKIYQQIVGIKLLEALIKFEKLDINKIKSWQNKILKWFELYSENTNKSTKDVTDYLFVEIMKSIDVIANKDFKWLKKLSFILNLNLKKKNLDRWYAHACFSIAPNDKFSIDVFIKEEVFSYIFQLKNRDSIIYALDTLFQENKVDLLCDYIPFDFLQIFQNNLNEFYNKNLGEILKQIVEDLVYKKYSNCNKIIKIFIQVLIQNNDLYLHDLVDLIHKVYKNKIWALRSNDIYILDYIDKNNFDIFMKKLDVFKDYKIEVVQILYNGANKEIKELIEKQYFKEILESRKRIEKNNALEKEHQEHLCKEWIEDCLNPLEYYNIYKDDLVDCSLFNQGFQKTINWVKDILENGNYDNRFDFKDAIKFIFDNKIELSLQARDNIFVSLPNAFSNEHEMFLDLVQKPSETAIKRLIERYENAETDKTINLYGIIEFYSRTKRKELEPLLLDMLDKDFLYDRAMIIDILPNSILTKERIRENIAKLDKKSFLYEKYLCRLIEQYNDKDAIEEAIAWVKKKAENLEEELDTYFDTNPIAFALSHSNYSIKEDKEFLNFTSRLYKKNKASGGNFIRDEIVYEHIKYLLDKDINNGLKAINIMEEHTFQNKETLYNFQYKLIDLKKAYLSKQKTPNIMKSIKKYNELIKNDYLPISSPMELLETIKEVIDKDIRRWIEDEGAYKRINELTKTKKRKYAEEFISKSIKNRIELAFFQRGFRGTDFILKREEQKEDDERLDFTISYGFIGSVVLELKLSHNSEAIITHNKAKEYISRLKSYIKGSGSSFGLFVIFNIEDNREKFDKKILELKKFYDDEEYITVLGLDCVNVSK